MFVHISWLHLWSIEICVVNRLQERSRISGSPQFFAQDRGRQDCWAGFGIIYPGWLPWWLPKSMGEFLPEVFQPTRQTSYCLTWYFWGHWRNFWSSGFSSGFGSLRNPQADGTTNLFVDKDMILRVDAALAGGSGGGSWPIKRGGTPTGDLLVCLGCRDV